MKKRLIFIIIMILLAAGQINPAYAAEDENEDDNLYLPVNADYDRAYSVISSINSNRSKNGVHSLSVDQTLMDAALIRATETIVYFEHARPNGGSWSSVSPKVMGENLGRGTGSVSKIMQLWMESPGHRENILRGEFNSVGAACVEHGGVYYWVQLFGTSGGSGADHPENGIVSVALDLPAADADSSFSYEYEITGEGITDDAAFAPVELKQGAELELGLSGGGLAFDPARLRWTVSPEEIAEIDDEGVLHIKERGRADIKAYSGSIERAGIEVDSREHIEEAYILENLPFVTVLGKEGPLKQGRDYNLRIITTDMPEDEEGSSAADAEDAPKKYAGYTLRGTGEYKGIVNCLNN